MDPFDEGPLVRVIRPRGFLLIWMEYATEVIHLIMRITHFSWKPILWKIVSRQPYSTWLYAFLMSSFKATPPPLLPPLHPFFTQYDSWFQKLPKCFNDKSLCLKSTMIFPNNVFFFWKALIMFSIIRSITFWYDKLSVVDHYLHYCTWIHHLKSLYIPSLTFSHPYK